MQLFCKLTKKQPRLSYVWKCCTFRNNRLNNYFEKSLLINFSHTLDNLHTLNKFSFAFRSSCSQIMFKIDRCLKRFAIFTGKHLCRSVLLTTLQFFSHGTVFKKVSNTGVFLWILRTAASACLRVTLFSLIILIV